MTAGLSTLLLCLGPCTEEAFSEQPLVPATELGTQTQMGPKCMRAPRSAQWTATPDLTSLPVNPGPLPYRQDNPLALHFVIQNQNTLPDEWKSSWTVGENI